MRLGFVVNPVAGMGGRVGLKGTDGKVDEARERGAERRSHDRAVAALRAARDRLGDRELTLLTAGGPMGEDAAREAGLTPTVVTDPPADPFETRAADTRAAVRAVLDREADLVAFVGGDGTAVDVAETLTEAGVDTPVLGVPAGVKVYSGVFGATPAAAGRLLAGYAPGDPTERREVNDIDEDAFRGGEVETELRAVVRVPTGEDVQSSKQLGGGSVEAVAAGVASEVEPGHTYVLGPGSTLAAVKRAIGFEGSPLGVDLYRDGEATLDVAETDLLAALREDPRHNVIVVSPIGGQGFFFGRGNQQISPAVIRRSRVEVVASAEKLDGTGVLRVDTGDPDLDDELRGWRKVRVGRFERRMVQVV
jgi:NAD+ kinase